MSIEHFISRVEDESELENCMNSLDNNFHSLFKKCLQVALKGDLKSDDYILEIDTILDYLQDVLNTGHWSKIPNDIRRAFTSASFIKAALLLRCSAKKDDIFLKKILKCIDLGLLLGAPLSNNEELLTASAEYISKILSAQIANLNVDVDLSEFSVRLESIDDYKALDGQEVDELEKPSVEMFGNSYYENQLPVKLKDCISYWSAFKKWGDVSYLLKLAGQRTVPVEIGSSYADEDWSQKLMTLEQFIKSFYLSSDCTGNKNIGYLAQHNLFDQIPELRADIGIPEYCSLSRDYENASSEPDINAWFGPKGTISPLHQDIKDNLLCQVLGYKQIILFSPKDTGYLGPFEDHLLSNTSRVNPIKPDLQNYPEFSKAHMFKCLLKPGEIIYIPPKWWHHVTSLTKSFSVSFWWD